MKIRSKLLNFAVVAVVASAGGAGIAVAAFAGSDAAAPSAATDDGIPFDGDRIPIAGADGTAGYADRSDLAARPAIPGERASQAQIDRAISEWEHTPIRVTATADPNSKVVGYFVHTIGFIDMATFSASGFDLDGLLAQRKDEIEKLDQWFEQYQIDHGYESPEPPVTELSK
jgi:hypothetical protein